MKRIILLLLILPIYSIGQTSKNVTTTILQELRKPAGKNVIVVAHRGDWRNAPENSIQAIENVIEMGVDVVEIDVQKTKDGKLILMHDTSLDRTTTGKGLVSDHTMDEISKLFLRNGAGVATRHRVPTLEEALACTRNRILVNIDKGYDYFSDCYDILVATGTLNQVIIKGGFSYEKVHNQNAGILSKSIYMPIVNLDKANASKIILDFQKKYRPVAYEFVFKSDTSALLNNFRKIKEGGSRVWVNSLWPSLNAGHDDDLSVEEKNPEGGWGWIIDRGANIIQTDRPKELIEYLRKRGLHN